MVYSIVEHLDITADANCYRSDYEPMEHFASYAV